MCKRNTQDPLVRAFLDRYHLNLLLVPRENATCGELYVEDDRGVSTPGNVNHILEPPVLLPSMVRAERLANLEGITSMRVEAKVGLGLLENFFVAVGATGIVSKLKTNYEKKKTRHIRFRFRDLTRDSIDPFELGSVLQDSRLSSSHPFVQEGNHYYIVASVVWTPSICIYAEDDQSKAVDIDLEALYTAKGQAKVSAGRSEAGEVTYSGTKNLAIGVELYEMIFAKETDKLIMKVQRRALRLRRGPLKPKISPAFIGSEDGDIFVKVN